MSSRTSLRRVLGPSVGYGVVGLSVFALLASGPRLLGGNEYSVLGASWTAITIFGLGLAYPAEQLVTTIVAAGGDRGQIWRIQGLVAAALLLLVGSILTGAMTTVVGGGPLWVLGVGLGAVGWAAGVIPKGGLSGEGRFEAYGSVLVVEGITRIALCVAAWFVPQPAWFLAGALALPLLASALAAWLMAGPPTGDSGVRQVHKLAALALVALSFQALMNAGPLVLQARLPGDLAGMFVSALTYMRIPYLLVSGFLTVLLSGAAHAWSSADRSSLDRAIRLGGIGVAVTFALTVGVWSVSGVILPIFYGSPVSLDASFLALLGVAMALGSAAMLLTQIPLGARRQAAMAAIWVPAAGVGVGLMMLVPPSPVGVTVGTIVGAVLCILPTVLVIWGLRTRITRAA